MTLGQEARKAYSTMLHTSNPTQGNQQKKQTPKSLWRQSSTTRSSCWQWTTFVLCNKFVIISTDWIGLSMVLRLLQHNIGYTADGFYKSDDPTNSVKALKEGG